MSSDKSTDVKKQQLPLLIIVDVMDEPSSSRDILAPAKAFQAIGGMEGLTLEMSGEGQTQMVRTMMTDKSWQQHRTKPAAHKGMAVLPVATSAVIRLTIYKEARLAPDIDPSKWPVVCE